MKQKASMLGAEIVSAYEDQLPEHDSRDRPQLEEAIKRCEQERIDFFIIYWRYTISEHDVDFHHLQERLSQAGTELVCCQ